MQKKSFSKYNTQTFNFDKKSMQTCRTKLLVYVTDNTVMLCLMLVNFRLISMSTVFYLNVILEGYLSTFKQIQGKVQLTENIQPTTLFWKVLTLLNYLFLDIAWALIAYRTIFFIILTNTYVHYPILMFPDLSLCYLKY